MTVAHANDDGEVRGALVDDIDTVEDALSVVGVIEAWGAWLGRDWEEGCSAEPREDSKRSHKHRLKLYGDLNKISKFKILNG
jgi:hypothetical protein